LPGVASGTLTDGDPGLRSRSGPAVPAEAGDDPMGNSELVWCSKQEQRTDLALREPRSSWTWSEAPQVAEDVRGIRPVIRTLSNPT
jgi:hypothetical protein